MANARINKELQELEKQYSVFYLGTLSSTNKPIPTGSSTSLDPKAQPSREEHSKSSSNSKDSPSNLPSSPSKLKCGTPTSTKKVSSAKT